MSKHSPKGGNLYKYAAKHPSASWGLVWRMLGGEIMVGAGAHAMWRARERGKCYGWPWPPRLFNPTPEDPT